MSFVRDAVVVLRELDNAKRFSCFEVDSSLGAALNEIKERKWATFDTTSVGYPWTKVDITEAGRAALAARAA